MAAVKADTCESELAEGWLVLFLIFPQERNLFVTSYC